MFRLSDVMQMLDIPERTIRRHIKDGILKGTKVGGTWRFSEEDIANYLENSHIKKNQRKSAFSKIMEYMSDFNTDRKDVVFIKNIEKLNYSKSTKLSMVTKNLKNPLYFNMTNSGKVSTITFRGNEEDALVFLRELNLIIQ